MDIDVRRSIVNVVLSSMEYTLGKDIDKRRRCIVQVRIHALSSSGGSWDRRTEEGGGDGDVVDTSDG